MQHGLSKLPEYQVWKGIKKRCFNKMEPAYPRYGGKGITMAPEWVDNFPAFLAHVGSRPTPKHSIDRIDGTKGYVPGNLRWATAQEQNRNKPGWVVELTLHGRTMLLTDWAQELGLTVQTLKSRLQRGWPIEQVLSPAKKRPGKPDHLLTLDGVTLPIPEWARRTGLQKGTIANRLRRGWTVKAALTLPLAPPKLQTAARA